MRSSAVATHLRPGDTRLGMVRVDNISLGGVFVRTSTALPPGTALTLELVGPGLRGSLGLTGKVVCVVAPTQGADAALPGGLGIQFDAMGREVEGRLAALIRSLAVSRPGRAPLPGGARTLTATLAATVPFRPEPPRLAPVAVPRSEPPRLAPVPASPPAPARPPAVPPPRLAVSVAVGAPRPAPLSETAALAAEVRRLMGEVDALRGELEAARREADRLRAENARLRLAGPDLEP